MAKDQRGAGEPAFIGGGVMNGFTEKVEITEKDVEEMCQLAEDVMDQLHMNFMSYDAEGNDIFNKYYSKEGDFEKDIRPLILQEHMDMEKMLESQLLYDLFRRGDDIGKVRYYTTEEIRPWIEPIIPKALQMFRKGTNHCGDCPYRAADSVPDSCLIAAFAREVRNRMMIFAGQRMQSSKACRYLLLLEYPGLRDADEWKGIYFDDENLKNAYDELIAELEEDRKKDFPYYRSLQAAIYEFCPTDERMEEAACRQGARDTKQRIRAVKPEDLCCFKKGDGVGTSQ